MTISYKRGARSIEGLEADFTAITPAAGQDYYATDTGEKKTGDGATAWASLPVNNALAVTEVQNSTTPLTAADTLNFADGLRAVEGSGVNVVRLAMEGYKDGVSVAAQSDDVYRVDFKSFPTVVLNGRTLEVTAPSVTGFQAGDPLDNVNFRSNTNSNWGGSVAAISPNFGSRDRLDITVDAALTGELLAPTGVAGLDDVGDWAQVLLVLTQDAGGTNAIPSTIFGATNYAGGIEGYFPVINTNTAGDTPLNIILEGRVIAGPTTVWTVKMPPRPAETIATYSGTAKTWNSDNINDENTYLIFSNAAAKTYTPASTEGMRANDRVTFFNTGAGDLTVAAGAGITLFGDLVFAQNKGGGIVWATATTGHVWGGST